MHDCVDVIIGGSNTLMDPCRSNIGGVLTPVTPAALTPMLQIAFFHSHVMQLKDIKLHQTLLCLLINQLKIAHL